MSFYAIWRQGEISVNPVPVGLGTSWDSLATLNCAWLMASHPEPKREGLPELQTIQEGRSGSHPQVSHPALMQG